MLGLSVVISLVSASRPHNDLFVVLRSKLCVIIILEYNFNNNRGLVLVGANGCWCLSSDVKAVESQYNALLTGDEQKLLLWMEERRKIVKDRHEVRDRS